MNLCPEALEVNVRRALEEDLGDVGDLTVAASLPSGSSGEAVILTRQAGVLAGVPIARACFQALDADVVFGEGDLSDGAELMPDGVIMTVRGSAAALLSAERTALNFLQRMSGIATCTASFVAAVEGCDVKILDTRKTTPLLREFEKYAVLVGGGTNHRIGLFDQILLKENHFSLSGQPYQQVVEAAVALATAPVVAEAQTLEEGLAAVAGGASIVLLDNFQPGPDLRATADSLRRAAAERGRAVEIEASGGVTLASVRAFAECGVDRISVGVLTHSVDALDMSMATTALPKGLL
ncbi:MAG: carboxylating nicotinate-nucleotide diphosphorylase [Planctomycetota bacterium]|nr:carboxylating nicotinate-nucleotide diphosphorylase [Planctomycetota bacterium]